jgi:hypothetical protein
VLVPAAAEQLHEVRAVPCSSPPSLYEPEAERPDIDTGYGIICSVAAGKILQKMRQNRAGWRIEDLPAVAEGNSIEWRRPGRGGSHVIFTAPGVREILSVPAKRPIKPVYVKQFLALIDAVGAMRRK